MEKKNFKIGLVALGVCALICVGMLFGLHKPSEVQTESSQEIKSTEVKHSVGRGSGSASRSRRDRGTRPVHLSKKAGPSQVKAIEVDEEEFTPEEQGLVDRIERALDEERFDLAQACVDEASNCGNPDIRQKMVETLGWFGVKALAELTPFLADENEDVREAAQDEWSMALNEIENEAEKIGVVEQTMQVLNNEDFLEDISGEYIGVDEKLAVESLLRIIENVEGSKAGIAKAKETYEFVTGDEFTDRAAAEKWLREEYTPPEQ